MADLGKSQVRQVEDLGNSPAGQTGLPTSSRGNAYRTSGSVNTGQALVSKDIVLVSTLSPAGFSQPVGTSHGTHYAPRSSSADSMTHTSKNTNLVSPSITPAGFGSQENTSGHGLHYAELGAKYDNITTRTGKSTSLFSGKLGSGATQADAGALPIVTGGGPSVTTYFLMRARDPDCVGQPAYVYWKVTGTPDSTGAQYSGSRCGGSPLVEIVVEHTWKQ